VTKIRRALVLVAAASAIVLGTVGPTASPAVAQLADSAAVGTTTISTGTVAPPTNVVGKLTCTSPATMSATWTRSTQPRVNGYTLKVYFTDGFVQSVDLPATAASWSATIDRYYVQVDAIQYSVTAKTDYGWTAESAKTPWFQC
jgi:hypothetical protein